MMYVPEISQRGEMVPQLYYLLLETILKAEEARLTRLGLILLTSHSFCSHTHSFCSHTPLSVQTSPCC